MEHEFEILKIIQYGVTGDKSNLIVYTNQLIEKLKQSGKSKQADRVLRALNQDKQITLYLQS